MARKSKSTVTQEELDALESAIQTLADDPAGAGETKEYLGEAGLKRLVELVSDALKAKKDSFSEGYGLALEDGVLKVTLDTSLFVVVKELPTEPAAEDEGKLHLVPMGETEEGNEYAEYLWVNGAWELMGTLHTKVDLSGYLPLTGGTLTGRLIGTDIQSDSVYAQGINQSSEIGKLQAVGTVIFTNLAENADAPNVVVADDDGKLYKAPKSEIGGPDYELEAITDAEIDALFDE